MKSARLAPKENTRKEVLYLARNVLPDGTATGTKGTPDAPRAKPVRSAHPKPHIVRLHVKNARREHTATRMERFKLLSASCVAKGNTILTRGKGIFPPASLAPRDDGPVTSGEHKTVMNAKPGHIKTVLVRRRIA